MFELGSLGRHLSELELQEWDAVKLNTNPDIPLGWNNADGKTFRVRRDMTPVLVYVLLLVLLQIVLE